MQSVIDVVNQTCSSIAPVARGLLEITMSLIPGAASKGKENGQLIKSDVGQPTIIQKVGKPPMVISRNWIRVAGVSGALAVALGAYGAHAVMMDEKISDERKHSFRTANMYHFIGTFGMVTAVLAKYPRVTGALMLIGTTLFSGSCYYYGFTGESSVKKVAPIGGSTLIVAWISLIF